jgi:hypothetical protein
VNFTPSIFRQHEPNPGAGLCVEGLEWLRTITSIPLKTPASNICVLATGGIISSPGVPKTVIDPGAWVRSISSAIATAAAIPTGPCALC